jgi:hypothetical protein
MTRLFSSFRHREEKYIYQFHLTFHRTEITYDAEEIIYLILSSVLCLGADLFPFPGFDTVLIGFAVEICFGSEMYCCLRLRCSLTLLKTNVCVNAPI